MTDQNMMEWVERQVDEGKQLLLIPTTPAIFQFDGATGEINAVREANWNHFQLVTKRWKYDINLS